MKRQSIDDLICSMRFMAKFLMPNTFPQVTPQEENDINYFKTREVIVDGYEVTLTLSRACYPNHYLESLQISGKVCSIFAFPIGL